MGKPKKPTAHRPFAILLGGVGLLLTLSGLYLWFLGGTNPAAATGVGGAFQLTSSDGRTVTDRSFRGQYLLIYFGYASCHDVCPDTLTAMTGALAALGPRAARIQPLFITVDPQRDTPAALHRYVANFSPRLIGLTGTARQLHAVQRAYQVSTVTHPGGPRDGIDHSSVLLLMSPDGALVAPIRADESSAEMAADLGGALKP